MPYTVSDMAPIASGRAEHIKAELDSFCEHLADFGNIADFQSRLGMNVHMYLVYGNTNYDRAGVDKDLRDLEGRYHKTILSQKQSFYTQVDLYGNRLPFPFGLFLVFDMDTLTISAYMAARTG